MAALRPNTEPGERPRQDGGDESIAPMPRWVKVFAAVLAVLLLVFVVMHLAGGGFRGHGS